MEPRLKNLIINEINPSLKWMVFKAKQRAKNNYFEKRLRLSLTSQ